MHVIVYRLKPKQPWTFITYYSGTKSEADQSAYWTEEQERNIFKNAKVVVKVLSVKQWDKLQSRL
jgi:hypothetical protein